MRENTGDGLTGMYEQQNYTCVQVGRLSNFLRNVGRSGPVGASRLSARPPSTSVRQRPVSWQNQDYRKN